MEQKIKHFKKRDAILNCVKSTKVHPSAEWVFAELKPDISDLSLGTVYRNLALFKEQGLIVSLGTVNGVERFDGNTHPHVHFICNGCGSVLDLEGVEVPPSLAQKAADLIGSVVEDCSLTYKGFCSTCKSKILN